MAIAPSLLAVIDWAHAQFRLETARDRFEIGEHGVRAPKYLVVPVDWIGSQLIHPWVSALAAFFGLEVPLEIDHIYSYWV